RTARSSHVVVPDRSGRDGNRGRGGNVARRRGRATSPGRTGIAPDGGRRRARGHLRLGEPGALAASGSARNLRGVAAPKPTPLSVQDWLQAGYTLLAEQGARALKVERLCQQAGVTRGSFYWHFEDMDSYRAALVESWNTFLEKDRRSLDELDALPPRERLS